MAVEHLRRFDFRGKARLLHAMSPQQGEKHATIFGAAFRLDLGDYIQRSMYLGTFEPAEARVLANYLRRGMTFVDVGANVGYFTAVAATMVGPTGRVVAFEPSPYASGRLSSMVEGNRLTQVEVVDAGLSDAAGTLNLYLGRNSRNHTPTMVPHENATETSVSVRTLDSEMARLGITRIDLVKVDVEGYETKVLAGAKHLLAERRIHAILCEFNDAWLVRAGSSSAHLERLIVDAGFIEKHYRRRHSGLANRFFCLRND